MQHAFYMLKSGLVFRNGRRIDRRATALQLGDVLEVFQDRHYQLLGFVHLWRCLPTLRFRLTLKDSIVNTEIFYSLLVRNYSFFPWPKLLY